MIDIQAWDRWNMISVEMIEFGVILNDFDIVQNNAHVSLRDPWSATLSDDFQRVGQAFFGAWEIQALT